MFTIYVIIDCCCKTTTLKVMHPRLGWSHDKNKEESRCGLCGKSFESRKQRNQDNHDVYDTVNDMSKVMKKSDSKRSGKYLENW